MTDREMKEEVFARAQATVDLAVENIAVVIMMDLNRQAKANGSYVRHGPSDEDLSDEDDDKTTYRGTLHTEEIAAAICQHLSEHGHLYGLTADHLALPADRAKVRRHKAAPGECVTCDREREIGDKNQFHPSHDASPRCESGKHAHCSCDTCF
jgi:hypothetical protein